MVKEEWGKQTKKERARWYQSYYNERFAASAKQYTRNEYWKKNWLSRLSYQSKKNPNPINYKTMKTPLPKK